MIDRAVLNTLIETTDREFVSELIDAYLEESPELIAAMRSALDEGKQVEFTRAAHSLKSSSASLGAVELSEHAKALELAGREGSIVDVGPSLEQLTNEYIQVEQALKEFQNES